MDSKRATADQKVKDAIKNLNDAVQILPEALDVIDRELDQQYIQKSKIESATILLEEARTAANREIDSACLRARENILRIASMCSVTEQFKLLPTAEHELREPYMLLRLFDLLILSRADNLKTVFNDPEIVKNWPSYALGKEDRASRIAALEKSILQKEIAREALAVKFAEIKIFVDRRPTTPAEVILEFDGGKWNREKLSRLGIEFNGMQHQVQVFDEKLRPLAKDLSESEQQLRMGNFEFVPQQKLQLETAIKGLKFQISDLRKQREDVEKRRSHLNQLLNNLQEFLQSKGLDSGLNP